MDWIHSNILFCVDSDAGDVYCVGMRGGHSAGSVGPYINSVAKRWYIFYLSINYIPNYMEDYVTCSNRYMSTLEFSDVFTCAKDCVGCKTAAMCGVFISVHHLLSANISFAIAIFVFTSQHPKQKVILPSCYNCGNRHRFSFNHNSREIYTTRAKLTLYNI